MKRAMVVAVLSLCYAVFAAPSTRPQGAKIFEKRIAPSLKLEVYTIVDSGAAATMPSTAFSGVDSDDDTRVEYVVTSLDDNRVVLQLSAIHRLGPLTPASGRLRIFDACMSGNSLLVLQKIDAWTMLVGGPAGGQAQGVAVVRGTAAKDSEVSGPIVTGGSISQCSSGSVEVKLCVVRDQELVRKVELEPTR